MTPDPSYPFGQFQHSEKPPYEMSKNRVYQCDICEERMLSDEASPVSRRNT
jgi:hypothetical protein